MTNAFKQKQDQAQRDKLLAESKAALSSSGVVNCHRTIDAYVRQAGVPKEQAERALGLR